MEVSGALVMFAFLIWVPVTLVCSFCENLSSCTFMIYTLFYMDIITLMKRKKKYNFEVA